VSVEGLRQELALDVVDALEKAREALNATMIEVCAKAGLTVGQRSCLLLLAAFPSGVSLSDLARVQDTSRQYAHSVVRACVRRGWVATTSDAQRVSACLTEQGQAMVARLREDTAVVVARAVRGMTVDDLKHLLHLLNRFSGSCQPRAMSEPRMSAEGARPQAPSPAVASEEA